MDAKQCFKCGETKPLADFYRHPRMADGHLNKCKECAKRDTRKDYHTDREKHAAYERKRFQDPARKAKAVQYLRSHRARYPDKTIARRAIGNAIRSGRITRPPCQRCGSTGNVQAHHHDYSKPLDVRWLCFACHQWEHGKQAIPQNGEPKPDRFWENN